MNLKCDALGLKTGFAFFFKLRSNVITFCDFFFLKIYYKESMYSKLEDKVENCSPNQFE